MWNQSEAWVCRFMRSVSADLSICYSCSPLAVAFSAPKASCCWRPSLRSPPKQASPKRQHFESLLTSAKVFASQRLLQSDALPFSCTDCTKSTFIFVFSLVVIYDSRSWLSLCLHATNISCSVRTGPVRTVLTTSICQWKTWMGTRFDVDLPVLTRESVSAAPSTLS